MNVNVNQIGVKYFLDKIDCKSQYGKLALKTLPKLSSNDEILARQELLIRSISLDEEIVSDARRVFSNIKNITLILKNIASGQSVEIVDLHEVKIQAMHTRNLQKILGRSMFAFKDVDKVISVLDPNGENSFSFRLYESYDPELNEIIRRKREIEYEYYNCEDGMKQAVMQKRDKVVLEEQIRTEVVIKSIVSDLKKYITNMIDNVELLTLCDLVLSQSLVYKNYSYCVTQFSDTFEIESACFPLVSDNVNNYTPLNISLNKGSTLIVGANMGGKSTILKNIAFNVYLVNYGLLPLAKKFVMPTINNIVFLQSFEDTAHGLSRFGSEVKMLNSALDLLDESTIFFIDEFASSTNPTEGYLFVKSLINYCSTLNSYSVLTTHYDNLTKECDTYVVCGVSQTDDKDLSLSDLMNYDIVKTNEDSIPKQAMIVAKHMDVNDKYLKILEENYKKEGQNGIKN